MVKAPERSDLARKNPWPAFMFASSISAPAIGLRVSPSTTRPVMRLVSPRAWPGRHARRISGTRRAIRISRRVMGGLLVGRRRFGKDDDREPVERGALDGAAQDA